jgi:hypothetical protein
MRGLGQADALGPLVPGRPPDMMALQNYNVNRAGQPEVIWQPQYDYQVYPMAGATQFTFFQTTIGAGGTTRADTSMTAAGQMSRPIEFLITGIQVYFRPGNAVARAGLATATVQENWNDVNKVMYAADSWLELFIGSKAYLDDGPIGKFPGVFGISGGGWRASSSANATNVGDAFIDYAKATGRYYSITPVKLPANQNFNVTLNFPALIPASVAGTIGVILDGFLYRLSQ